MSIPITLVLNRIDADRGNYAQCAGLFGQISNLVQYLPNESAVELLAQMSNRGNAFERIAELAASISKLHLAASKARVLAIIRVRSLIDDGSDAILPVETDPALQRDRALALLLEALSIANTLLASVPPDAAAREQLSERLVLMHRLADEVIRI